MPRSVGISTPKYRKHRASGQAVVTVAGKDHYLGPWRSRASIVEYDRLIAEWLAAGRPASMAAPDEITVAELLVRYRRWAKGYYRKNGKPTPTITNIQVAARALRQMYGHRPAAEFGPLALKALRQKWIDADLARSYVNRLVDFTRRIFKWGVAEQLVAPSVYQALAAVAGLKKGRTSARETEPVKPVAEATIEATLPHLPETVADMVRLQRLTGCRPQEVCIIRPCDVDPTGEVWIYHPESHKTEHHGRERVALLGPRAQDILRPYLLRPTDAYCFDPRDSERKRLAQRHEQRTTPLSCGNRPGTNRKRKAKRAAGDHYTTITYRRAIERACDKAFLAPAELDEKAKREWYRAHRWTPNRLRHATATDIRKRYGLEAAQIILGHAKADVTQVYAERDIAKAVQVMREVG